MQHLHHHVHDVLVTGIAALERRRLSGGSPGLPGPALSPLWSCCSQPLPDESVWPRAYLSLWPPRSRSPAPSHSPPRPVSRAGLAHRGLQPVLEARAARGSPARRGRPHPRWGRGSRVLHALLAVGRRSGSRAGMSWRRAARQGQEELGEIRDCGGRGRGVGVGKGGTHLSFGSWRSSLALRVPRAAVTVTHSGHGPAAGLTRPWRSPSRLSLRGGRPHLGRPAKSTESDCAVTAGCSQDCLSGTPLGVPPGQWECEGAGTDSPLHRGARSSRGSPRGEREMRRGTPLAGSSPILPAARRSPRFLQPCPFPPSSQAPRICSAPNPTSQP